MDDQKSSGTHCNRGQYRYFEGERIVIAIPNERSTLALAMLQLFPPSIRESLISDPDFRSSYGLKVDAKVSFGNSGISVRKSTLLNGVRKLLAERSLRPTLKDMTGAEWQLQIVQQDNKLLIALAQGERQLILPDFSALSPDDTERLNSFERTAEEVNLPQRAIIKWHAILSSHALSDEEIDVLYTEIEETPIRVAALVRSELERGISNLSSLVPHSERYFERLVGECLQSLSIAEYACAGALDHFRQLMSWRDYNGFLLALLLSSHSFNSSAIEIDQIKEEHLIQAYDWLRSNGDRVSQLGAIEIGLSILDRQPKIEHFIRDMIEQIRDDNAYNAGSRFELLSSLIILVEGELSRTKVLRDKPPFWRRLSSIAQASLIEREIIGLKVDVADFSRWAVQPRGQLFYLQTMSDLRREPRWYPDFVSPHQLRSEFIGRIVGAARLNASKIEKSALHELLLGENPESLQYLVEFPFAYLPGPIEGGLESKTEPPAEILRDIEEKLSADVLHPKSFAVLINSALIFRFDAHQARLAAKALSAVKHQLRQIDNKEQLFTVLSGLATVAAVTRSVELAEELRILTRRFRNEQGCTLSAEESMQIGLIAAAAHSDLTDWCKFVGEWITELSFQSLQHDEMERLHSHIMLKCHIVPELWRTCGRAEAALSAGMAS
jgi:hypothetical protein